MLDVYSCYGPIWVKILSNKQTQKKKDEIKEILIELNELKQQQQQQLKK